MPNRPPSFQPRSAVSDQPGRHVALETRGPQATPVERQPGFLAPFQLRGYRFLWIADLFTASAIEMEILILGWYVLTTTGSVVMLTLLGSVHYIGTLVAPVAGMIGDRIGLRPLLVAMRLFYLTLALTLAALAVTDRLTPLIAIVIAGFASIARSSDTGMRTALCAQVVPGNQLMRSVGISRTTSDAARAAGALTGAGLFGLLGLAPAYAIVSICHLCGTLFTLGARAEGEHATAQSKVAEPRRSSPWRDIWEGLAYVWRTPHLLAGMCLACLVNFSAFPLTSGLLPYVAREVFHLDQNGLARLTTSFLVGAFAGAMLMSLAGGRIKAGRLTILGGVSWHLAIMAFPWATAPWIAMGILLLAGIAQGVCLVPLSGLLLRTSEPALRGRVMGARMLAINSLPFGLLLAGWLIERVGFIATVMAYGAGGMLLVLAIALNWRSSLWQRDALANQN